MILGNSKTASIGTDEIEGADLARRCRFRMRNRNAQVVLESKERWILKLDVAAACPLVGTSRSSTCEKRRLRNLFECQVGARGALYLELLHVTTPLSKIGIFVQSCWRRCNETNNLQCCSSYSDPSPT
jgi:hypothetical protein